MAKQKFKRIFHRICRTLLLLQLLPLPATASEIITQTGIPATTITYHHDIADPRCCLVISHAGGAYLGQYYTNSLEALEWNYATGRRVFELDFRISTDGALVLTHDWDWNENQPLSRAAFVDCSACPLQKSGLTALDDEGLIDWLRQHPDALIITDAKDLFSLFLETIIQRIPEPLLRQQFMFQIYNDADAELLSKTLPDMQAIFTIYRTHFDESKISWLAEFPGLVALTLPASKAGELLPAIRSRYPALPLYVHGKPGIINSAELHETLFRQGASGFYLD